MADDPNPNPNPDPNPAPEAVDLGTFMPETFKGQDGKWDTAGFRAKYDEAVAFQAREADRLAQLPKEPKDYAFALSQDHKFPEGFDPKLMVTKDAQGNDVAFDPSKLIDANDPDIPLVQSVLKEIGAPADAAAKIAGIFANRELRGIMKANAFAQEQIAALGPQAKERIATVERAANGLMPAAQAKAFVDSITSADGLRAAEALIAKSKPPVAQAPGGKDFSSMSPQERVLAGLQQRKRA